MHAISPLPNWFPLTVCLLQGLTSEKLKPKRQTFSLGYGVCNTTSIAEAAPYQDFEGDLMDFKAYLALQSLQSNLCRSSLYIPYKSTPLANKDLGVDKCPQTKQRCSSSPSPLLYCSMRQQRELYSPRRACLYELQNSFPRDCVEIVFVDLRVSLLHQWVEDNLSMPAKFLGGSRSLEGHSKIDAHRKCSHFLSAKFILSKHKKFSFGVRWFQTL